MSAETPSRRSTVSAIVAKDVRSFTRDRFWLFMTGLAIVWFVALYYLLPDTVDETIRVGVHWTESDAAFEAAFAREAGIEWVRFESREDLEAALGMTSEQGEDERGLWDRAKDAVGLGDSSDRPEPLEIGVDFPEDFLVEVFLTLPTQVRLYVDAEVPDEVRDGLAMLIRESAYSLTDNPLPVTLPAPETIVLGEDLAGDQVPMREKLKPLYAFVMLMMETFALGALISDELSSKTVTAVLATPARLVDFITGKAIVGTALAFTEAMLIMILVRAFGEQPLMLTLTLLLGALLVTGIAMIVGASGRDFIGMIFLSMVFMIPLIIPAFAALFPGTASPWVKVLPSYGLVQAIIGATTGGATWSEVAPYLATLGLWCLAALVAGALVLRRKVADL